MLTWDPPPYQDQNGVIISYDIDVTVIETGETFVITSNDTLLSVTGLRPYRSYICTIAASTSVGLGPYSASITVETPEDGKVHIMQLPSYCVELSEDTYNITYSVVACISVWCCI